MKHSGGGAFYGLAAGGAGQYQVTTAPTVDELEGWGGSSGASFGPKLIEVTGEYTQMENGYKGLNLGVGSSVGPLPVEIHAMWEYSEIVWKENIFDIAGEIIEGWIDSLLKGSKTDENCED